jgi:hypothetical protein
MNKQTTVKWQQNKLSPKATIQRMKQQKAKIISILCQIVICMDLKTEWNVSSWNIITQ